MGKSGRQHAAILGAAVIICAGVIAAACIIVFVANDDDKDDDPTVINPQTTTTTTTSAPETHDGFAESVFGEYRYAAVADSAGPCASVGVDIMAMKGGSAVDAAIAMAVCIGVVHCQSSGIGGGHFITIYDTPNNESDRVMNTILARERAPLAATEDMFVNASSTATVLGGLAIAVPGEVKGFYRAWQKFGRVPWSDLFTPTIRMCREGYEVTAKQGLDIAREEEYIRADHYLRELFVKGDGSLVTGGDTLFRPKMGATLQAIADDPNAFYNRDSQLAQDIIADIAEYGGIITLEDLEGYEVYDKDPLSATLDNGGYTVYGVVPPSSGVIINYALKILDEYGFNPSSINADNAVLTYHRIAEAFKFAYAKRSALGDEDFVDVTELMANLTNPDYAAATRARITDDRTHDIAYYEPAFDSPQDGGTAQLAILAPDGSAASITTSVNLLFGSKVRGNRTGIIFNNHMDDFSTPGLNNFFGFPPSPSNFIAPGKIPMSSMSPTIVLDSEGVVRYIAGAAGGSRIITGVANVLMNGMWFGLPADEANDRHRFHHQLTPNEIRVEQGFDEDIIAGLEEKGHTVSRWPRFLSIAQNIENTCRRTQRGVTADDRCVTAAGDGRGTGRADGF